MVHPTTRGSHMSLTDKAESVSFGKSETLTLKMGDKSSVVIKENITEVAETIMIIGDKRWCASSIENRMPEMGAPVATENPAHAPPVME